ncbi:flavodoxin domain-containing protein [Desulfococcus sp.]|uniref:flavodoxin domain-containing protein n=1 Tax=Desulfococcus sp. TaxID=2025834 RepID=UPI003593B242
MKKVLIAYASRTGKTQKMAEFIAEGIRISGHAADVKKISDFKKAEEIDNYDAYVFGCPTYHRDMTAGMKTFLFLAENLNLTGKMGGAFGSYTHSGESAPMIFDTMEFVYKMDMTDLGALSLKEAIIDTTDGKKACQDYGKSVGTKLPL